MSTNWESIRNENEPIQIQKGRATRIVNGMSDDLDLTIKSKSPRKSAISNYGTYVQFKPYKRNGHDESDTDDDEDNNDDDCTILLNRSNKMKRNQNGTPSSGLQEEFDVDSSSKPSGRARKMMNTLNTQLTDCVNGCTTSISRSSCYVGTASYLTQCARFLARFSKFYSYTKVAFLVVYCLFCVVMFSIYDEVEEEWNQAVMTNATHLPFESLRSIQSSSRYIRMSLDGPFESSNETRREAIRNGSAYLIIDIYEKKDASRLLSKSLGSWIVLIKKDSSDSDIYAAKNVIKKDFQLKRSYSPDELTFGVLTSSSHPIPLVYHTTWLGNQYGNRIVYATLLLLFVYGLIVFELTHRCLAAALGAIGGISVLALIEQSKPSLNTITTWVEWETILLMFGMMIIVAIFCETGLFDLIAVRIFNYSANRVWIMITSLCLLAATLSAFLDNVTTVLLLTPITIRLCEVMNLDPRRIIIAEVIFSNIGGTSTAIGDPPNVIITANAVINSRGIDFSTFTLHMLVGSIFVYAISFLNFRLIYADPRNFSKKEEGELDEMKQEIKIWQRAFQNIIPVTKEEKIVKTLLKAKTSQLSYLLAQRVEERKKNFEDTLKNKSRDLMETYKITNVPLLIKCCLIFSITLLLFFLNPFVEAIHLTIGWISILAAILLLAATSNIASSSTTSSNESHSSNETEMRRRDSSVETDEAKTMSESTGSLPGIEFEAVLHKVEWSTLLFFASLFIFMKCIEELGLLNAIGDLISDLIRSVGNKSDRLVFALFILLVISALTSSLIDNIPMTTAMIPIILQLSDSADLPLEPLVYALAFGSCLGGNGTLIGASCNLVAAGISEQHGYKITFKKFFVTSFPTMIVSVLCALLYVCVTCVYLDWY